jgi:predicted TIM-barrel fold metal-dependent hydrolase
MKRRSFLGHVAAAGAAILPRPAGGASTTPDGGPYVDIHTHLTQGWATKAALSADALLRWMDANNIEQAVVLPLINPESWFYAITTADVLRETRQHRDRLIPFCSIDPRTINLSADGAKRDVLRRYKDEGARGLGESKPGVAMDDPRNLDLFAVAAEVNLPVLFHLDNNRNFDEPGLPGLTKVLEQTPGGTFIGHAQGFWASISGDVSKDEMQGYPKGPVAPGGALDALFDRFPNLYGDLSAGSGLNGITRDAEFGRAFLERRRDRLLFGTDYLEPGQAVGQIDLYREIDISAEARAKICRENARRVLGL